MRTLMERRLAKKTIVEEDYHPKIVDISRPQGDEDQRFDVETTKVVEEQDEDSENRIYRLEMRVKSLEAALAHLANQDRLFKKFKL